MGRNRNIVVTLECDRPLDELFPHSRLGGHRLWFEKVSDGLYRSNSTIKVWACERHSVVERFLERNLGKFRYYKGPASAIKGLFWNPIKDFSSETCHANE